MFNTVETQEEGEKSRWRSFYEERNFNFHGEDLSALRHTLTHVMFFFFSLLTNLEVTVAFSRKVSVCVVQSPTGEFFLKYSSRKLPCCCFSGLSASSVFCLHAVHFIKLCILLCSAAAKANADRALTGGGKHTSPLRTCSLHAALCTSKLRDRVSGVV